MTDPAASQVHRRTGLEAFEHGDYRTAAYYLSGRVGAAPQDIEARCKLGASYSQLGLHDQGLDLLRQVVQQRPGQPEILFYYGTALSLAGRKVEADRTFRQVLRLQPEHAGARTWAAQLHQERQARDRRVYRGTAAHLATVAGAHVLGRIYPAVVAILLLVFLGPYFLVIWGLNGIRTAQEGPFLRTVSYQQFAASPPQKGWYRVTGCLLDCSRAGYHTWDTRGLARPEVVFIPVYGMESTDADRTPLVLETTNQTLLRLVGRVIAHEKGTDPTLTAEEAIVPMDLQGVLSPPADVAPSYLRAVNLLQPILTPRYVVMHDGEKPNLAQAIGMLVGGIVWGIVWIAGIVRFARRRWKRGRIPQPG